MSKISVFVTGGGTGGHLMPAIAICELLNAEFEPFLITDSRCENFIPKDINFDYKIIELKRPKGIFGIFNFLNSLSKSLLELYLLIKQKNPKAIITCGGYSSLPLMLLAIILRKKFILHEQNAIVGKANYWFSYFADKLFLSFIHTVNLPIIDSSRFVWTGIPVRNAHRKNSNLDKAKSDSFKILVTGGSQAAQFFDDIIPEAIKIVKAKNKDLKIEITQQVRSRDEIELQNFYKEIGAEANLAKFFPNLDEIYPQIDLFIGRSGASTISEIINYSIASILIPYPYAKQNHQYLNAKNLSEFGAAEIMEQKNISAEKISAIIEMAIKNPSKLDGFRNKLTQLQIDTAKIITAEIKKVIDK